MPTGLGPRPTCSCSPPGSSRYTMTPNDNADQLRGPRIPRPSSAASACSAALSRVLHTPTLISFAQEHCPQVGLDAALIAPIVIREVVCHPCDEGRADRD